MCKRSDSIKELAISLAKFNANVQRIEKDSTNPHYRNKYASLDGIMDEIRPMLAEQGLSIIQMPSGENDQLCLTTMLVHVSGEWIESAPIVMRPVKTDPQGIGSATTYARRYSLCAFLGLSTGEVDDDGNAASQAPQGQQNAQKPTYSQPHNSPQASNTSQSIASGNVINEKQVTLVKTRMNVNKIPSSWIADTINDKYGINSVSKLTKPQLDELLKLMDAYKPVPVQDENLQDLPF